MWITLFVLAAAVSVEPFRVGMTVVMLNRPRPALQLAAFLCGGFAMGLSVGAIVLGIAGSRLPVSARVAAPTVQIILGVAVLAAAGWLALTSGSPRTSPGWLTGLLEGHSLRVAAVTGLGIALPSADYLAALAVLATADINSGTRLAGLLMFNVVAFALVEIPLLAYLIAPQRTRSAMAALHGWVRSRSRRQVAAALAAVGGVMLTAGVLSV
jgi:hypothetical protein